MGSARQMPIKIGDELGVALARDLAVIGNLADIPKQRHVRRRRRDIGDLAVGAQGFESRDVIGRTRSRQALLARQFAKRRVQSVEGAEIEFAIAPLQRANAIEAVRLETFDRIGVDRLGAARHAEGAVIHMPAGAARDLADLAGRQIAMVLAVEFPQAPKTPRDRRRG